MFVRFKKDFMSFEEGDIVNVYSNEADELVGMNVADSLGLNPFNQKKRSDNLERTENGRR